MSSGIPSSFGPERSTRHSGGGLAGLCATYTTDGVEPADRLEDFDRMQVHSDHPMHVTSPSRGSFGAHARAIDLGVVNVVDLCCSPARVERTPQLVRQLDPELVSVVMVTSGRLVVEQAGRRALLQPGELAFYTSWNPFQIDIESDTSTARLVRAHMPRALLAPVTGNLDKKVATALPGRRGVGGLLGDFLNRVKEDSAEYSPTDAPRLANLLVDLVTATIAHDADDRAVTSTAAHHALLSQIMAFVRQRLHDPRLSPASSAAAHHISLSYLHRLFQVHDSTLGAWIRRERLDRARRDLMDPQFVHLPVHRIGARWGYQDHATFTRAFRASFGVPPRDFRRGLIEPPPGAGEQHSHRSTRTALAREPRSDS